MPVRGPTGRRHAVPYNTYIEHERQKKYYKRQKTLTKFRRLQRYEGRQHGGTQNEGGPSFAMERALQLGPEAFDAEYERRLVLSFGEGGRSLQPAAKRKRRRCKAAGKEDNGRSVAAQEAAGNAALQQPRGRKRKVKSSAKELFGAEEATKGKRGQKGSKTVEAGAAPRRRRKAARADAKKPGRYAKALREHEEAQRAREEERQRWRDEVRRRNRARRAHRRGRALKGQVLAQRTARGQPRMQARLEAITAKLLGQADGGGKSK
mmetsp:Transcript_111691/g.310847  ORF Transcript_111691/g.310847 Transcript_111691/m.310847 type:complete len:264 (-) Transcript_111691:94-885(-)|eukprot:CAMPEP_0179065840 /NCGR_PEP_ID=MMETSP0796-20121207/28669_1 /TAXON_ID=73915 /ORGANISM="Pyrodinium bahamense, Strain pbaha01" /LENGTH=263 /DNA_ID=CAMNT_0020762827 /DNA_START=125 /DNA_END=916 /DNA_ORIENTATION=-